MLAIQFVPGTARAGATAAPHAAVTVNAEALLQLERPDTPTMPLPDARAHRTIIAPKHVVGAERRGLPLPLPIQSHPAEVRREAKKKGIPSLPEASSPVVPASRLVVLFDGASARPQSAAVRRIDQLAAAFKGGPDRFLIAATAPGRPGHNSASRRLSLARGQAVGTLLHDDGIAHDRIIVQALGDPPSMATNFATLSIIP